MPPFRFSLEQVLNYRTQLEQQAKVELARVEQERLREQQRADTLRAMLDEQERALAALTRIKRANAGWRKISSRGCART